MQRLVHLGRPMTGTQVSAPKTAPILRCVNTASDFVNAL
jgi:hypothetical protein